MESFRIWWILYGFVIYWTKQERYGKIMGHMAFCAEEYDAKIRQTLPFYDEFYEQVVDILAVWGREELSWLDIGCGTGKMYEAAGKRLPVREFVFTDISEEMLAVAGERFLAGRNRFERMSVLELEDIERYDVVTAIQVHHYLPGKDRRAALERCCRALKPGGLFFTFENIAPDSEIGRQLVLARWNGYQVRNGRSREEADSHMKRYGVDYFPLTVEAHFELMRKCGFHAVELIWMSYMQAGFMGIKQ